ncbi:MAG: ABC1 kinase family protein [Thiohalomonadales bacterium]
MINIKNLPQRARNRARFNEVVSILVKYDLANWLGSVDVDWVQKFLRGADAGAIAIRKLTPNQRVRLALTELGTTYIKLGQILSTRPDLVGSALAQELTELQSNTPSDPPETVTRIIQEELQQTIEEAFASFDIQPLASASIAQVHRATLFSGEEVVVKVQHADIENRVRNDLEILILLAGLAEQVSSSVRQYQPKKTAEEFSKILLRELDFSREANNIQRFRLNFAKNESVCIPAVYEAYSSKRVLTMDYLEGISLTQKQALLDANLNLEKLAKIGAQMFLDMVFRDGFYHADPHPGNLLVLANGSIGLLDCGMVGRLSDNLREQVEDMALAIANQDINRLTGFVVKLCQIPRNFDREALSADLEDFLTDIGNQSIANFDFTGALNGMTHIIREHQIIMPPKIAMLIKVLVMLEGTARQLDPDFSLVELLDGYKQAAIKRRLSPQRMRSKFQSGARDWVELAERFPGDDADILERVKTGSFDIHLDHRRLDSIVNRLVIGILAAALFLGSTLLWSQSVPPIYHDISLPGALGYFAAIYLGFKLIRAVKRSGDI